MKNIEILRIHIKNTQTYFKNVMKETNYKNKKKTKLNFNGSAEMKIKNRKLS